MAPTRDYVVRMPRDTTVVAACWQVRCESYQFGWETAVDERTPLGREQAAYIRQQSGRTFTELSGPPTVFRFEPRQRCFAEHRTRPARWLVHGGGVRVHQDMAAWVGDLDEHMTRLDDQIRKG